MWVWGWRGGVGGTFPSHPWPGPALQAAARLRREGGAGAGRWRGGPGCSGMAEVLEFRVPTGSAKTLLVWGLEPEPGLEVR